jgi:hypothetical protein
MLRLSTTIRCAVAAAALLATTASMAQAGGLGGRLTDAGTKLDQDSQACRPINLGEYVELLREAGQNKRRAEKAAKAGVPIDQAQVDADLANASALFNRAQAALVQQCMPAAQGQGQPQAQPQTVPTPAGTPIPATTPTPAVTPAAPGAGTGGTESAIDAAEKKLAEDIKECRPINVHEYDALATEAYGNVMVASKAANAGVPIDVPQLTSDYQRANALLERARKAEAAQKACPPKREATSEPPPKTTGALIPNSPPLSRFAQDVLAAHNQARQAMNAAPLRWNPLLADHATARAREMAQIGQLVHAPREGRGTERENILQAPLSYSPTQMMERWTYERTHYVPGLFPNVSDTGNWMDVAHWTQMVWGTTTDVGCGSAPGGGFNWLVCRYNPGGNKDGKPVVTQPQIAQGGGTTDASSAQSASLFDLGIYAGGAWATDWFTDPLPEFSSSRDNQIGLNHEYGYDAALFVGYDLGAFRLEAEVAYKRANEGEGGDPGWLRDILLSLPPTYVDTSVEQPQLPKGEAFKPKPPENLEDPM